MLARKSAAAAVLTASALMAAPMSASAQTQNGTVIVPSVRTSSDGSVLNLDLGNGRTIAIDVSDGMVRVNGEVAAHFSAQVDFEDSWRALLAQADQLDSRDILQAVQAWQAGASDQTEHLRSLRESLTAVSSAQVAAAQSTEATRVALARAEAAYASAQNQSERAREEAARAMEQAARAHERAMEEAERSRERARRAVERARERAQRDRERAQRDRERALRDAQRERERATERLQQRLDAQPTGDLGETVIFDLNGEIAPQVDRLREQLERFDRVGLDVRNADTQGGDVTIGRSRHIDGNLATMFGDLSIYGHVDGNVVAVEGDVFLHGGSRVEGDVISVNGRVTRAGGHVGGRVRSIMGAGSIDGVRGLAAVTARPDARFNVSPLRLRQMSVGEQMGQGAASLLGVFIALACIGFGFAFFMPQQLELVSTTVTDSFGKSFLAGMFAQPLLIPAALLLVLGLTITVVGIPVALLAAVAIPAVVVALGVGGYLAAARSVGNAYLLRKASRGEPVVVTPYRSMVYGLAGLLAIWMPAVLLGWIPVAGQAFVILAALFTWAMATAGFGATILSREGLRATWRRPARLAAVTDEHYWPVDTESVSAARRSRRSR